MTERRCIVTREVLYSDEMIRFVAGPNGEVVPDLKRKLPGRGVWVTANHDLVQQAVKQKAFARGLKTSVKADEDLPQLVDRMLVEQALGALGFARKAGECVTGLSKVESALRAGRVVALLHASDGAEDGLRKLVNAVTAATASKGKTRKVWREFDSMQLDLALGATNVIHAAITKGEAARNCKSRIALLVDYRGKAVEKQPNETTAPVVRDEKI